ncbi:MAG: long-chain fatty acid--CoA ligase [Candidatus Eisenbacteria bacterium]|nr:long-chain fatty acid--CoA ligase [Candidatus Eisenbacteria bacterium]
MGLPSSGVGDWVVSLPGSISEAFSRAAALYADRPALMRKDARGTYRALTYAELSRFVDGLARSLLKLGLRPGERVGILARNCPEWVVADLAALKSGAVVVPLYTTVSSAALKYVMLDSGMSIVFAGDAKFFAAVDSLRGEVDSVREVVVFEPAGTERGAVFTSFWPLVREGAEHAPASAGAAATVPAATPDAASPGSEWPPITLDDAATIVYTSGTTGEPKGVVLSHRNILSNVVCSIERFKLSPKDRYLSFLPLSHTFERTAGYYSALLAGVRIAYAEDISTIVQDAQLIRPTCLIVVPRILEKVYEAAQNKLAESTPFRKRLVRAAIVNLNRRVNLRYKNRRVPVALRLRCLFYDAVVARKFRKVPGGKLRFVVSGSAPLDKRLAKTLTVLGFNLFEGYGLTETSPSVCCTHFGDNRLGTVGKPYDGVEVRIGENSEVLVRGPNVMKGYFNKPEETARVIDTEGWFHTGDQGRLDRDGNLIITGRIKELIVTSYGKNIAPVPIETSIKESDYVEDVMLHGDREKYVVAIVVAQREAVERYASENAVVAAGYEELLQTPEIRSLVESEIERTTRHCSPFEKVKAFTVVSEGFTLANDLITPTLKLRREKVREKYRNAIEAMYGRPAAS